MLKELSNEIGSEDNCSDIAVLCGFLATESKAKKKQPSKSVISEWGKLSIKEVYLKQDFPWGTNA